MAAAQESLRQIWSWNSEVPATIDGLVHEIVAQNALKEPASIAVHAWDGNWTYQELDWISTKLAEILYARGQRHCSKVVVVPLCFEKSKWTSVAMLGAMKAGRISVALDVSQPVERLRSIVDQTQAGLILCTSATSRIAGELSHTARILQVDVEVVPSQIEEDLPRLSPDQTLFVTYTSGSSGRPKGACISHANVCSAVHYQGTKLGFTRHSNVLDFAPYSFDVAWSNMLHTFCAGGTLCTPSTDAMYTDLASCIDEYDVTLINVTPTILRTIVRQPVGLTDVLLSGEAADVELLARWAGRVRLRNTYGPAECTFKSTFAEVSLQNEIEPSNIGTGHGAVIWIVDAEDPSRLASLGETGEVWLEGPLVGQGYLNDAERTASAFVQNPSWLAKGQIRQVGRGGLLYRTGDLARYSTDGSIAFVGRRDRQVKINGSRVELGDVEHHLRRCLECAFNDEVAVEAIVPRDGESLLLVAFSTCKRPAGLQERMAEALPRYMIPSVYIHIADGLPRTATGKTNRRQLRETYSCYDFQDLNAMMSRETLKNEPSTAMERRLQALWAKILSIPALCIGSDDSFLHLGGDSVRAMMLVSSAREQGLSFTVAEVFRHPKLCDIAAKIQEQDAEQHEEQIEPFSLLRNTKTTRAKEEAASGCGVDATQIEDIFPCTPLQEGLMALTTQRPGEYVSTRSYELHHKVDIDRLQNAWRQVVKAAPILRTRIVPLDGQIVQVILRDDPSWLRGEDAGLANARNAMVLGSPLAQVLLSHELDGTRRLTLILHHAIVDGWSRAVLMEMLQRAYAGDTLHRSPPFQLFVKHVMSMNHTRAESDWNKYLEGLAAPAFPALLMNEYMPRATASVKHNIAGLQWPRCDITTPTMIQVALAMLLEQYTGANDIVFGSTMSGRDAPVAGIERMTGPTVATVPIRILLDGDETIEKLLARVQSQSLDLKPFEQLGLSRIRQLSPEAEQACHFQTLLVIHPDDQTVLSSEDPVDLSTPDATDSGYASEDSEEQAKSEDLLLMTARSEAGREWDNDGANTYGLMIACQLREAGADITVKFDPTLTEEAYVQRMLTQLETVVRQLACADRWTAKSSDVSATSKHDLEDIRKWNRLAPEPMGGVVHTILSDVAKEQPDALAIHAWDGDLTHSQLDSLSTRLAENLLSSLQLRADDIVPICHEKSKWTSVAILGVIKAGAATLVFDVTQPEQRSQSMVEQVRPKVVLTSTASTALANAISADAKVLQMQTLLQPAKSRDLPIVKPEHALFLVFTSGSSGQPKGIVIDHQNFSSALVHQTAQLGFTKDTRTLDFASYAFDASYYNLFHTLYAGGCLCVPSEDERHNDLAGSLLRLGATFANLTPKVAELLDEDSLRQLDLLELSGESANASAVQQMRQHTKVRFAYGPAECSVMSTISSEHAPSGTIGRGVGTCCWVVDTPRTHFLTPIGGVGELWLEGPLVGREYFNDSDKTKAAFVQDPPWLHQACGRKGWTYRTGDLVRYSTDGDLIFLGRRDGQAKIRGQRVELNEIAHHVQQCLAESDVEATVVAGLGVPPGYSNSQLVAFVVLDNAQSMTPEQVTRVLEGLVKGTPERLSAAVPSYMIPSRFVPLSKVPLTTTGKIDRQSLRRVIEALEPSDASLSARNEPPLTHTERRLGSLWARVLRIQEDGFGRKMTFWDLGGDSITAMSLLVAVRKEFGVEMKISMLTSRTTSLEQLSTRIDELQSGRNELQEAKIDVRGDLAGILTRLEAVASNCRSATALDLPHRAPIAFLTGATGFLGTEILRGLLSSGRFHKVVVLVRATNNLHGLDRVRRSAQNAGWWSETNVGAVEIWTGDLSKPRLGLTASRWTRLSGSGAVHDAVDVVIHNGAAVHWTSEYAALKATNIDSTAQLVQAAVQSQRIKRFVYISGGVSWSGMEDSRLAEDGEVSAYAKTKYVSERIVIGVADHPNPPRGMFSVVKPALIIGNATSGVPNVGDFLWRYVRSCIRIRAFPSEPAGSWLPIAETRRVTARILEQAMAEQAVTFSCIDSGMLVESFWEAVQAALDFDLRRTEMVEWKITIRDDIQLRKEAHPLWPVQQFLGRLGVDHLVLQHGDKPGEHGQVEQLQQAVTRNLQYLQHAGLLE